MNEFIYKINEISIYSLQEMLILKGVDENATFPFNEKIPTFKAFCALYSYAIPKDLEIDLINELWQNIYGRYFSEIFATINEDEKKEKQRDNNFYFSCKIGVLISKMMRTLPYYKAVFEAYDAQKENLLSAVKTISKTTTGFNDTPQNENTGGVFEGDNYLTNFAKGNSEIAADIETPMARLKEVQDSYSQLLNKWVYEFDDLFTEERNYEQ